MIDISLEEILTKENFENALDDLGGRRDACGPDGIPLSSLPDYWKINGKRIIRLLNEGEYRPGAVYDVEIINYRGKKRSISIMNSIDRLILRTISQAVQPLCDSLIPDNCHAFREGKGVNTAIMQVCDYLECGYLWVVNIDIEKYFDIIPLSRMQSLMAKTFSDKKLVSLLQRYLTVKVEEDGRLVRKKKGILQGSPISPLFANLYLASLDRDYMDHGYKYCRYSDDINIYFKDYDDAVTCYEQTEHILHTEFGLDINIKKSGVKKALQDIYLGYQFELDPKSGAVTAFKQRRESKSIYNGWKRDGIQRIDRNYHLINDGILTKRDYTILFENKDGKKYIPVEATDSISIYSNVTFSSDFFKFLSDKRIYLALVNKYGNIVGHFCGTGNDTEGKMMLKQAEVYLNDKKRLQLAKSMEIAYVHNIIANIKYYNRRGESKELAKWLKEYTAIKDEINRAKDMTALLLTEARCRQSYYRMFNEIIHVPGFEFKERTKRPPRDPLNAMISFGNTILYNRIAMEIYKTSLDIRVGIVHSTNKRSQTLNLDVADLFKPILVDRTIFTLINRRVINIERDFERGEDGSVYFSNIGKRIFLGEFNRKLYQKLTENGRTISYDTKIKQELRKLANYFMHGEKYKPYKYTNKDSVNPLSKVV